MLPCKRRYNLATLFGWSVQDRLRGHAMTRILMHCSGAWFSGLASMALPWNARLVVLFLYALHSCPQPAVLVYLRRRRRRVGDDVLLRMAEDVLLSSTEAELVDLMKEDCEFARQRDLARQILSEYAVYQWCVNQNERGLAPKTAQIVREAGKYIDLPSSLRSSRAGGVSTAARVWAVGWRKRWNVKVGLARSADVLDASELRNKVRHFFFVFWGWVSSPVCGTSLCACIYECAFSGAALWAHIADRDFACALEVILQFPAILCKAMSLWRWSNWLSGESAGAVVRINVDETCIPLFHGDKMGNVCKPQRTKTRKVTRAQRRLCFSYVCLICDDTELQRALPQYILANERGVRKQDLSKIAANLPVNVRLLRRKSAWADASFCAALLRDLRETLAQHGCVRKVILFWDCARPHLVPSVLARARKLHIHPIIIPPRTTGVLQPLDTHAFGPFKRKLEDALHEIDIQASGDTLSAPCFLQCVGNAIQSIITRGNWKRSFVANGLCGSQDDLSKGIVSAIGGAMPFSSECAKPALEDIAWCFPKRYVLNSRIAYGTTSEPVARPRAGVSNSRRPAEQLGRTRSETLRMRRGLNLD